MELINSTSVKAYKGKLSSELSFIEGVTEIPFVVYEMAPEMWVAYVHIDIEIITCKEEAQIKSIIEEFIVNHKAKISAIKFIRY